MNDSREALDESRKRELDHLEDSDGEMEMKKSLEESRNKVKEVRRSLMETQMRKWEMRNRVESLSEGAESRRNLVEMRPGVAARLEH